MARLSHIYRHPLKAHGREALQSVSLIAGQTMPWDRHWAVAHEAAKLTADVWGPCANFTRGSKAPLLMAIEARLDSDAGVLHLTHPDLDDISFAPDDADDVARFIAWSAPLVPVDRAQSASIVSLPKRGWTDTPFASISINSHASLADLSAKAGCDLSPLRWRGNFWVEGSAPWEEFNWIGREAMLGTARLAIKEPIVRCRATTSNPETGKIDVDTLATLNTDYGHQDFGVYAEVIADGDVSINDELVIL